MYGTRLGDNMRDDATQDKNSRRNEVIRDGNRQDEVTILEGTPLHGTGF